MFKNYLKIALRDFWKNKTFSLINIIGLTVATACCLIILVYVRDQYGYDDYHQGSDRLYRVTTEIREGENNDFLAATCSPPVIPAMRRDFPEIEAATRLLSPPGKESYLLSNMDKKFYETKGYYADTGFFNVFSFKFLEGSPSHALENPYSLVISSEVANKMFGKSNPLNQVIKIDNGRIFKVTAVFDENFGKSHLQPHFLMSMNSGDMGDFVLKSDQWLGQNFVHGYVRFHEGVNPKTFEQKLAPFLSRHGGKQLAGMPVNKSFHLQPVKSIHLHSKLNYEIDKNADAAFIRILILIAALIQIMACINFMNLSTARSTKRAKEVGIRKAVGAGKLSLVLGFLSESVFLSLLSVSLAAPLVIISVPWINAHLNTGIPDSFMGDGWIWIIITLLVLVTGLLAGLYPAFYLTAYRAVSSLKGNMQNNLSSVGLRKGLVVSQFVISIGLVISVIVITDQLSFLQSKNLGFDQKQKILIPFRNEEARKAWAVFKTNLVSKSEVTMSAGSQYYPGQDVSESLPVDHMNGNQKFSSAVELNRVDPNYLDVLKIKLLEGRNFVALDTNNNVIVNEAALSRLGIAKNKAISQRLVFDYQGMHEEYTIIGVINNYNFKTLKEEVRPLMLQCARPENLQFLIADIKTTHYTRFFGELQSLWGRLIPDVPFEYSFLDQDLQKLYEAENSLLKIINLFSIFAIVIACLGLFGLAAFTTEQRIKEIGIRKVLGASVASIIALVLKGFAMLIAIAIIIASPIAFWAMQKWLQDYPYRITIGWWIFLLAGLLSLFIGLLTISFQAVRAATANPVQSLRSQ
jgi:putative ABC transport system permease protein